MLHGNIYPEAKVHSALSGFFRMENLVALRELSLRFVADETEEELLEFLRSRGPNGNGEVWDTAERILVAVTGAPGNDTVIRRAARIAARSKADLLVAARRRRARTLTQGNDDMPQVGGAGARRRRHVEGSWETATTLGRMWPQSWSTQRSITRSMRRSCSDTSEALAMAGSHPWRRSYSKILRARPDDAGIDVHVIARMHRAQRDRRPAELRGVGPCARSAMAASAAVACAVHAVVRQVGRAALKVPAPAGLGTGTCPRPPSGRAEPSGLLRAKHRLIDDVVVRPDH